MPEANVTLLLHAAASGDGRLRRAVECRCFAGLTEPETAEARGVSERIERRLWQGARDRLRRELAP
jgi:hypothetical protein